MNPLLVAERSDMVGEVIGFDTRLRREFYLGHRWSAELRSSYLLVPSTEWPLSVDSWVWPSLFDDPAASALRMDPLRHLLLQPDLGDFRQRAIGLWTSVSAMTGVVEQAEASERGVPIAIELFTEKGLERDPDWNPRLGGIGRCVPEQIAWYRAGFDVADVGFVSGLSNCGWIPEDEARLKERWTPHINEHGLLSDLGVAIDFRADAEERSPEHAPFFVYRIAVGSPL